MQNFKEWRDQSELHLKETLQSSLPINKFKEVLEYSVLPPGKLFRSLLIYCFAHDNKCFDENMALWASSIELHHTYTLIHDDLPAMDDDDMRRGRASNHKRFNEWSAILAGDALLAMSMGILSDLPPDKLPKLLKTYHEHVGISGLILGQVLDLEGEDSSLEQLLKVHELKTARLIQLSLIGANILANFPLKEKKCSDIGLAIGINFQLLDDLCELTEQISGHELEINPFLHFEATKLLDIIKTNTETLRYELDDQKMIFLKEYLNIYMEKIQSTLLNGFSHLQKHVAVSKEEIFKLKI